MEKEKKEIGKLLELLNEWQEKELGKAGAKYLMFDGINKVFRLNNGCSLCQELVLSHRFCFVKWLVDNDKIDGRKCLDLWYGIAVIDGCGEDVDVMRTFDEYEQLLILLAIQDEPIRFLCEIIK